MLRPVPHLVCTVIEQELRDAIGNGGLRLVYQPQVDMCNHRVVAYEALMRWSHPTRGELLPGSFLPLVQGSRLMPELTLWTVAEALRDWSGTPGPPVAVNICPTVIDDPSFADAIESLLEAHGARPQDLKLELIEQSLLLRPKRAIAVLRRLHDLGVRISIDDFGTGFSSLTHLRDMPVSEVKVDRSFVEALPRCDRSRRIVQTIVVLGSHLGIDIVGEGVSSPQLEKYLLATGCEIGQGFHLGYPTPFRELDLRKESAPEEECCQNEDGCQTSDLNVSH